ncbi:hypothetical protein [Leptolyngbya sp. PCC 6406]|uniref:hypothetical protein n=1 Tax=Leptolyngbya sp. PCC 6406 TaxID=1173264 RepID=UPI0002AC469E|nr:hypothetical protein [Leptolyngbya sp. PCC 6406]
MKATRALLTVSTLAFALGLAHPARGEDIALSFDLEAPGSRGTPGEKAAANGDDDSSVNTSVDTPATDSVVAGVTPLAIPATATAPPLADPSNVAPPAGVYGDGSALALGEGTFPEDMAQHLPAPPPTLTRAALLPPLPEPRVLLPGPSEPVDVGLTFDLMEPIDPSPVVAESATEDGRTADSGPIAPTESSRPGPLVQASGAETILSRLFDGGSDSLVALAVGSAEGTRTPEGHRTPAYFGHVDPGNGVWNLGTFSYQHGAQSPEDADEKQLRRLQSQSQTLRQKARAQGIELSEAELINGIDLANQAPLAVLDREGYVEWLARARALNMSEEEAIVWARTRSFLDPDTQRWNAPGLGNNIDSISRDQARRATAIARALALAPVVNPALPGRVATQQPPVPQSNRGRAEAIDVALNLDLPIVSFGANPVESPVIAEENPDSVAQNNTNTSTEENPDSVAQNNTSVQEDPNSIVAPLGQQSTTDTSAESAESAESDAPTSVSQPTVSVPPPHESPDNRILVGSEPDSGTYAADPGAFSPPRIDFPVIPGPEAKIEAMPLPIQALPKARVLPAKRPEGAGLATQP